MSTDVQPCKILGDSKETKVSFEWNFWEDILKIILLRHIKTGSFPYSSDGKYWLSIMMQGLPTQSWSKYYDLSNIFAIHSCLQPIKSEKWHFHVWRKHFIQSWRTCQKYWFFNERNPAFVYKICHEKRPNQCWPLRPLSILVWTIQSFLVDVGLRQVQWG